MWSRYLGNLREAQGALGSSGNLVLHAPCEPPSLKNPMSCGPCFGFRGLGFLGTLTTGCRIVKEENEKGTIISRNAFPKP